MADSWSVDGYAVSVGRPTTARVVTRTLVQIALLLTTSTAWDPSLKIVVSKGGGPSVLVRSCDSQYSVDVVMRRLQDEVQVWPLEAVLVSAAPSRRARRALRRLFDSESTSTTSDAG